MYPAILTIWLGTGLMNIAPQSLAVEIDQPSLPQEVGNLIDPRKSPQGQLILAMLAERGEEVESLLARGTDVNSPVMGQLPLVLAVNTGASEETIRQLLDRGADVNASDVDGNHALECAVRNNADKEIVAMLLNNGANPDCTSPNAGKDFGFIPQAPGGGLWAQPLHWAVRNGRQDLAQLLLNHGADINATSNSRGDTALLTAVYFDQEVILEFLLNCGADWNLTDKKGVTPLALTIRRNKETMAQKLLDHGADANFTGAKDGTTFLFSVRQISMASLLLNHGADVNARAKDGTTPLFTAAMAGETEIVSWLLNHGADVQVCASDGTTPLFVAVTRGGNEKIVSLLMEHGADVNDRADDGTTPLFRAVAYGPPEMVSFLLDHGATVDARDAKGETPLFSAVGNRSNRERQEKITSLLLAHGADVNVRANDGTTPLFTVWWGGLASLLLARGADIHVHAEDGTTPLFSAIRRQGEGRRVAMLLQAQGLDINAQANDGATPLIEAAKAGDSKAVSWSLGQGARIDIKDKQGRTALDVAKGPQIKKLLQERQSQLDSLLNSDEDVKQSIEGQPRLVFAVGKKMGLEVARSLLERGADVSATDDQGNHALDLAIQNNESKELVSLLLERGANPNPVPPQDEKAARRWMTPLCWAARHGRADLMQLLLKHGAKVDAVSGENDQTALSVVITWLGGWTSPSERGKLVEILLNYGADADLPNKVGWTPLDQAVEAKEEEIGLTLLNSGADIKKSHPTLAMNAATQDMSRLVKILVIDKGLGLDWWDEGRDKTLAASLLLAYAARWGDQELASFSLERNADINTGVGENTPLCAAVESNNRAMARFLLQHGADANLASPHLYAAPPLFTALNNKDKAMALLLLEHGADVNIKVKEFGTTPLFAVVINRDREMVQWLLDRGAKVDKEIIEQAGPSIKQLLVEHMKKRMK